MIFIGLFFCVIACALIFIRLMYRWTGTLVEGTIVGYARGAKGLYGFVGYNYRIRLEYDGELHYVTSVESVTVTDGTIPQKNLGLQCMVYFNPKSRAKRVALKDSHQVQWMALGLLITGVLSIMLGMVI